MVSASRYSRSDACFCRAASLDTGRLPDAPRLRHPALLLPPPHSRLVLPPSSGADSQPLASVSAPSSAVPPLPRPQYMSLVLILRAGEERAASLSRRHRPLVRPARLTLLPPSFTLLGLNPLPLRVVAALAAWPSTRLLEPWHPPLAMLRLSRSFFKTWYPLLAPTPVSARGPPLHEERARLNAISWSVRPLASPRRFRPAPSTTQSTLPLASSPRPSSWPHLPRPVPRLRRSSVGETPPPPPSSKLSAESAAKPRARKAQSIVRSTGGGGTSMANLFRFCLVSLRGAACRMTSYEDFCCFNLLLLLLLLLFSVGGHHLSSDGPIPQQVLHDK